MGSGFYEYMESAGYEVVNLKQIDREKFSLKYWLWVKVERFKLWRLW